MPSISSIVVPAARLMTTASGSSASTMPASVSGTMYGFTPMSTTRLPRTATRFASGSRSSASELTPSYWMASAFAAVRLVTVMPPVTVTSGFTSPARIAPPIEPAPMMAMEGKVVFTEHPGIAGMSTEGGIRAIVAALLANTGIAIAKFIAFLFSGSSAMLAESVHSLADAGNQVLLLIGGRRAKREGRCIASIRLRPDPLRLRLHRRDHPVLGRWCVLDLRGRQQAAAPASTRELVVADRRARGRDRARIVLPAHGDQGVEPRSGQAVLGRVRPPRQVPGAPGHPARRHRGPHRPDLRLHRCRPRGAHRQSGLGCDRHALHRRPADPGGDHPRRRRWRAC